MPEISYESEACDAMPDSDCPRDMRWIDLPSHRAVDEAVLDWLNRSDGTLSFRVSGASGTGKSCWLKRFADRHRALGVHSDQRLRWVVARFGRGEPVTAEGLARQWSRSLMPWVERPSRFSRGTEALKWLDLAIQAQRAEGFAVVRAIESDRRRLDDDPAASAMTQGILWLAREPFRGSRTSDLSVVLPVWSHDELATVLSRLFPSVDWTDSTVSEIWSKSSGRARLALKHAAAFVQKSMKSRNLG